MLLASDMIVLLLILGRWRHFVGTSRSIGRRCWCYACDWRAGCCFHSYHYIGGSVCSRGSMVDLRIGYDLSSPLSSNTASNTRCYETQNKYNNQPEVYNKNIYSIDYASDKCPFLDIDISLVLFWCLENSVSGWVQQTHDRLW